MRLSATDLDALNRTLSRLRDDFRMSHAPEYQEEIAVLDRVLTHLPASWLPPYERTFTIAYQSSDAQGDPKVRTVKLKARNRAAAQGMLEMLLRARHLAQGGHP